jgi:hypothetical protein
LIKLLLDLTATAIGEMEAETASPESGRGGPPDVFVVNLSKDAQACRARQPSGQNVTFGARLSPV